jgi:O-antigen/teichoic acid export membrane protein
MSVLSRIASALAANAFGQMVTVGTQLLLTPLFFRSWGAAKYGEWLILSSIPAYLTMADLGLGAAAGNEMTMRAGAGDRRGAQRTFLAALWVSVGASGVTVLVGVALAASAYLVPWPSTPSIPPPEAALILVGLALTVALGFAGGVVSAGFRCGERNALGIMLGNLARLAEALLTGALLWAQQSPAWVCLGMVLVKVVALLVQATLLWRVCPWLFVSGTDFEPGLVRRLIRPALGFLAFPLGNALALQGPVLIIGSVFGGAAVAMFSALRTLARVPMQLTTMINSSVWPEMSRAHGAGDQPLLRKLHRACWGATVESIVVMGAFLLVAGGWIVHRWLGAGAPFDAGVFFALVLLTLLASASGCSAVVLAAINAHLRLGVVVVVVQSASIALAALLAWPLGWAGLLLPLVLGEGLLLAWVMVRVLAVTADRWGEFLPAALREPWQRARGLLRR